jgi:signal transduction histidine kinase/ligand-binding sensor domain-containing protein/DNA-binding response OmpR family regulator
MDQYACRCTTNYLMHIVTNTATALRYACRLLAWLFLYFIGHPAVAQEYTPVDYLGIEQGLSNNAVTCIYQDHHGFMWFGTYDGLNRFDGYQFQVFRNKLNDDASLINNRIVTISEDRRDNIWVATKRGISLFSNRTSTFSAVYYTTPQGKRLPITIDVNDIQTDSTGNVFIGTGGNGLMILYTGAAAAVQVPCINGKDTLTGYHVQAVRFDWKKDAWVFVQGIGLCRYDKLTKMVRVVNNLVRTGICLEADDTGKLWLGSENGLFEYNITANTIKEYREWSGLTSDKVADLCLDKQNNLWIATDGGGINILNTHTGAIRYLLPGQYKKSLTSTAIQAVYVDKESRKWIGTLRGGINIIDLQKNKFKTIVHDPSDGNSLINNFVLSFCEETDGNLWIGTDGGGLSYWNREKDQYTNFEHSTTRPNTLSNNFVTSIVQDYRQNIWIATYGGGINRYNRTTNSFDRYACWYVAHNFEDRNVWKLYEDVDKDLWAGTCGGGRLYRLNQQKGWFELFDEKLTDVITLAEDRQGTLWAGTFNSLIKIDKKNKQHRYFTIGSAVRAIYEDKAGNCWIGTEGEGLLLFDRKRETFLRITETEGLANNSVLNILEDRRGNLWISTFNGLSKLDTTRKRFRNFYQSDGLQSNQFNYNAALISRKGEFIFGGIKGFTLFYPDSIAGTGDMPELRLTGFKVDNVPLHQDSMLAQNIDLFTLQEIELPYNKAISVDFVALEYSAPDKIAYAYFLEGWDKGWNYVGKWRTANYSRLQEGTYTLHIRSTNAEGIWNTQERAIQIHVLPPWYRSWWAWLLYIAMAIAAIYYYLLYKNRQAQLKYEVKLAHIKAEQEKDLNEKKLSFFTNVAHEFRTPLTLIINPVKELLYSNDPVKDTTGDLNIVYRNARRLLSLVDQLLLFRKAGSETGKLRVVKMNFVDLCREVFLCFIQQAQHKHIRYEFETSRENVELYVDREKMEIALFNLVSNALKFTPENGHVLVKVWDEGPYVKAAVADSGCGIPAEAGNKIFEKFYQAGGNDNSLKGGFGIGLNVVKNFVNNHQGVISYTSKKDQGTTFVIQLLKGTAHFDAGSIVEDSPVHSVLLKELVEEESFVTDNGPVIMEETEPEADPLVTDKPVMLIVDDDVPIREYVSRIFKEQFTLYEAGNGEDGLKLAQEYTPDIIISDVLMQGISGIELCNQVRENPSIAHIPVILLTSSASSDVKLKGIECGADDYITKPFDKELLVARVASLLKSRNNLQKYFYNEITLRGNNLKIPAEYKDFLDKCIAVVEKHLDNEAFSIKILAAEIGMSHSNLYKKVKSISGQSVNGFIRFIRLRKAAELFINTPCNVNEAAFQVGINDIKYFREQFNKLFGMNPSDYIKKYRKPFQKNYTVRKRNEK